MSMWCKEVQRQTLVLRHVMDGSFALLGHDPYHDNMITRT